ncbi:enoyl-CoA hydratase-related protein [Myxococcota bacterium]|nr:enoyl-CoA hydratase-related protein [Myxococcota bacterium]
MFDYDRYKKDLLVEVEDGILTLTLDNPEKMNANTEDMHWALSRIWDDIDADEDVRVVVFTGAGDRAFSAGGDPAHMQAMIDDPKLWRVTVREAKRLIFNMLECDTPIIARVNGHAVGFGATIALASDIIIAVEGARFGDPHINTGLVCGDGGALLWPQNIGFARAKEFLLTGELMTTQEAAAMGLINHAVPREELDTKVDELARKIAHGATRSIRLTKNVLNLPLRQLAHSLMDLGMANETLSSESADHQEAVTAFLEKRDAQFTGN